MKLAPLAALLLAPAAAAQEPRESAPARESVLLVTLDTTRRDYMGFLGRRPSPTPALDALAARSVVFTDAVTTAPLTLPAHASLHTGAWPATLGVHDNSLYRVPAAARTLAEILREQGYATGAAVAAFVLDPIFGLDQGFERYSAPPRRVSSARSLQFPELRAAEMVDRALEDLAGLAPRAPLFYWLHLFDPHNPYDPPAPPALSPLHALDPAAVTRTLYEAEIAGMDAQLGRLFGELERRGLLDRMVVVVASDHGEGLGEGLEATHGHFLFDPTVRVPLLLFDPRRAAARVDVPVSLVDVVPTLLARLGIDAAGERFDGIDLSPWIADPDRPHPDRVLALESWYVWLHYGWAPFEGCTSGPLKYVRSQREELFDRAADPSERTNLFAPDDPRALGLRGRLARLRAETAALSRESPGLSEADRGALRALGYATGGAGAELPLGDWSVLPDGYARLDVIRGFDEVAAAVEERAIGRAIELLRGLVAREPGSAIFHEQLGYLLVNVGGAGLAEAERELRRALELDPRCARAWFALARCALARRDAARLQARTARGKGDLPGARAAAKDEHEAAEEAGRSLRECLRLEPDYPEGLVELGKLLLEEAERAARQEQRERARALYAETEEIATRLLATVPEDAPEARDAESVRRLARARREALGG